MCPCRFRRRSKTLTVPTPRALRKRPATWRRPRRRTKGIRMLTKKEAKQHIRDAAKMYDAAGILLTSAEEQRIETADFGLGQFKETGLAVFVYVNTDRCCAKELAMWPRQT